MNKKLQVFVSSTYRDLTAERQAVVEAILRAGHIPAGMELFAAGDKSQLDIIRRWIDDSDVFMLVLGGRYGTIEPDSGKSYIQLEYEYAGGLNKPFFAVVMDDGYLDERIKACGKDVLEQDHPDLLKGFKATVTAKICRFFKNRDELKLAVHESLLDIERHRESVGWVRADALANPAPLIEQIGHLQKENAALREELNGIRAQLPSSERYNGYEFKEIYDRLNGALLAVPQPIQKERNCSSELSVLSIFWGYRRFYCSGIQTPGGLEIDWLAGPVASELILYGLVETAVQSMGGSVPFNYLTVRVNQVGRLFLSRLDRDEELRSQIAPVGS